MKIIFRLIDIYLNASIHVAIAVFSLLQITKLSFNNTSNSNLDYFVFFATILGYNLLRYFEVFWKGIFNLKSNVDIILVSFLSLLASICFYVALDFKIQLAFAAISLLVLTYPFIRKFPIIKMVFVSFCLTLITVYILQINSKIDFIYFLNRFIIIFCLLIPQEICDLETDSKTIKTLPQIIGIRNLKLLGYLLLLVFCFINFNLMNFIFATITAFSIFYSNENRSKYFASFWVENLPIIWWILSVL